MLHGGNIEHFKEERGCDEIFDFSANINPLGFPEWVRPFLGSLVSNLLHYPDHRYRKALLALSSYYKLRSEQFVLCNGIAEAISLLPHVFKIKKMALISPGFSQYERVFKRDSIEIHEVFFEDETFSFPEKKILQELNLGIDLLIINSPHNPTGKIIPKKKILDLASQFQDTIFIIDEAFLDFSNEETMIGCNLSNVVVFKSLTKILAVPGMRLGFIFGSDPIISQFKNAFPYWNVNIFASSLIEELYKNNPEEFFFKTRSELILLKNFFKERIKDFPLKVIESDANFYLVECLNKDAKKLSEVLLLEHGIALRTTTSFSGLDDSRFVRIAIRPIEEQEKLFQAMNEFYKRGIHKKKNRTPALMIQGTTSNAGKSLLCTAFCRIFYQDGLIVNPFKSQNMALNSYVTFEGGEIGRAQAVQAQAAKVAPSVLMNPILLKPNSDIGSQVILHGKPVAHMNFKEYFQIKPKFFEEVKKSYDEISSHSQIMVIEGAGSPAEVNLKSNDLVNMNMARYAKANVYIAADIDRGGMFASFMGTMNTFEEWERRLVKGFIINRFRGDSSLLKSGIEYLEKYQGVPTVGCIPHIEHRIPEEDCIEFKSGALDDQSELGDRLDIAVIDTPRISNFTDIDAFKGEPDVRLRIVRSTEELGRPHLILLCGSKSVMRDLSFLENSGLKRAILKEHHEKQTPIVGICGGYQFLGKKILDPNEIESPIKEMEGLDLLEVETILEKEKYLGLTKSFFIPWNLEVNGYEIHHGKTKALSSKVKTVLVTEKKEEIGHSNLTATVWGSYLHGIFDNDNFRRRFIDHLRGYYGKKSYNKILFRYDVDESINQLAKTVREFTDMDKIYKDLGL